MNTVLFLLPFAYFAALLAGLPAHVILARAGLFRLWHYALAGLAIGLLPGCLA